MYLSGNNQKLEKVRSGMYGGWRIWTMPCFTKIYWTSCDERADALSWCSIQSLLFHKSGRFFLIARRNRLIFFFFNISSLIHFIIHRFSLIKTLICSTFSGILAISIIPEWGSLSTDVRLFLNRLQHYLISLMDSSPYTLWIMWIVFENE